MTSPRCVCWLRFSCLVTPFYSPCENVWEIRRGRGERNACLVPFFLPCGISSFPHPRSRDAVIRREKERKREWDDQTNTFFSRRGMDNRARSAEKSGRRSSLCFSFFPRSFFFSQDRHTSSSSSSFSSRLGIEKGVTPGAHPVVPDGFQWRPSNETALGFLGMCTCTCNREGAENGGDASIIGWSELWHALFSVGGATKVFHGEWWRTIQRTRHIHSNLLFQFFNANSISSRWFHWFLNERDKLIG